MPYLDSNQLVEHQSAFYSQSDGANFCCCVTLTNAHRGELGKEYQNSSCHDSLPLISPSLATCCNAAPCPSMGDILGIVELKSTSDCLLAAIFMCTLLTFLLMSSGSVLLLKGIMDRNRFVSPRARGLAPAPSDQPIRDPKQEGLEGQLDHLTIEMYRNMMTGFGAAGDNNCAKCNETIGGGRPGCTALGQTFHLECFVCHVCNNRLAGGSFYSVEGKPHCEKDYMETLDKCNVCDKPVTDRILRASGRPYHPACFSCVACTKCLDGVPFTVDANNQIHCVECFHDKYAPRCARCSKPIVPEEGKEESMRVVAMDKSFHIDCYTCEDCGLSLSSKQEGRGCYPLDDHVLCKDCNVKRVQQLAK